MSQGLRCCSALMLQHTAMVQELTASSDGQ